jgi:cytoskeletal protein CcmA (bactofilin family)
MVGKKKIEEVKAFLGKGTEFEGKLLFTGSVRIEGKFKGQVVGGGPLTLVKAPASKGKSSSTTFSSVGKSSETWR